MYQSRSFFANNFCQFGSISKPKPKIVFGTGKFVPRTLNHTGSMWCKWLYGRLQGRDVRTEDVENHLVGIGVKGEVIIKKMEIQDNNPVFSVGVLLEFYVTLWIQNCVLWFFSETSVNSDIKSVYLRFFFRNIHSVYKK